MRRRTDPRPTPEDVEVAATAIAIEDGLRRVGHQSVAERLGVRPAVIAAAVPDEAALAARVFSRVSATELAEMKRLVLSTPSARKQLTLLLHAFAEPAGTEVDAIWLESWSLGRTNAALATVVRDEQSRWHEFVAAIVRRGVREGVFPTVDADEVAAQLLTVMDGVTAYALIGYRTELDRLRLLSAFVLAELGLDLAADEDRDVDAERGVRSPH